ncbi:MAG: hypothetical protein LBS00_05665, partial [Synergistaceae bacterium]|nr:hypothetical protein [Synergistaceae bacterium]
LSVGTIAKDDSTSRYLSVLVGAEGADVIYPDGTTKTLPGDSVIKVDSAGEITVSEDTGTGGGVTPSSSGGCDFGAGAVGSLILLAALWATRKGKM